MVDDFNLIDGRKIFIFSFERIHSGLTSRDVKFFDDHASNNISGECVIVLCMYYCFFLIAVIFNILVIMIYSKSL